MYKNESYQFEVTGTKEKPVVIARTVSRGEKMQAVARFDGTGECDIDKGKAIAAYRLEIIQRKRDLRNINDVVRVLKQRVFIERCTPKHLKTKLYDHFLQEACEERNHQIENIAYCKKMLKELTK